MMVGRSVSFKTQKEPAKPTTEALVIKDLVVKDSRGIEAVKGLDLTVRHGEVVGIAGVDGNGQSELIQALSGLRAIESGSIQLDGKDITKVPTRQRTEGGLGHIPEDRHKHGLVLQMGLDENIGLQTYYKEPLSKNGFLNKKAFVDLAERLIEEFDVRTPSPTVAAGALSGGNQQKAIIAREIDRNPSLLIAAQPTRGLDVGAIEYIHKRLIDQRNKGKAVLLMSFELDEILNVADRIAVMYEGRIVDVLDTKETNETELGLLMAGSTREQVRAKEQEAL
jgi:ABC superfamily ATP binding cassette transporter, ABC protein